MKPKILFLYTELAEYFLACVKALAAEHQAEVHIIRWPVNKEAPFKFEIPENINVYEKQDYTRELLVSLCQDIQPSLVFCSGWIDKDYLAVVRSFRKRIPVLVGMDNHWFGTAKQQIARLVAPFTLQRLFTHAFVAGLPQQKYARKLGFPENKIVSGYYAADVDLFRKAGKEVEALKEQNFPKRFIYVGRYIPQKGIDTMWEAFVQLQEEKPNEWELWCLGTGPLESSATKHPKIKHIGFVQPQEMRRYIQEAGVFVLPSYYEPWGVVVHEFAAAGFPLLCSREVGAATAFLENGVNGYTFEAGNIPALKQGMANLINLPGKALYQMGQKSVELALQNTPSKWAAKLMALV